MRQDLRRYSASTTARATGHVQEDFLAFLIEAEGGDPLAQNPRALGDARCNALLRVLVSAVWLSDADGRFTCAQASWAAFTGQPWPEHRAHGWLKAVHPDDRRHLVSLLRNAGKGRSLLSATVRLWNARHHGYRWCEARGMPLLGPAGGIAEWIGSCRDIDDQIRAEQALLDADRRKDDFMATLAHELRNPLVPIRNAVHILKRRGHDDLQLAWARDIISRQIAQASRLLDDLMDASRIKEGKVELRKLRITLDSALEQAIEESRPVLEQHGHHFELNALAGPVYLHADSARLVQVFSNLLNNAAKYTDPGGRVSLTIRMQGDHVVVSVTDTGIGLAPDMLSRIFDVYTQAETGTRQAQGGLGIGLALVKSLVELHGGDVEARSEGPGRGSEFIVRLPTSTRRADGRNGALQQAPNSLRVLVADDKVDAAETLGVLVTLAGHHALVVTNGQDAVDKAPAFAPDVALIELALPKLDGNEVARRLRAARPDMLLLATTGGRDTVDGHRAAGADFDDQLLKPIDPDRLSALLADVARRRAAR